MSIIIMFISITNLRAIGQSGLNPVRPNQMPNNNEERKKKMAETTKLKLQKVKVIFYNDVDEGFGTSITIDATDEAIKKQITDWVKANNIGKDNPGVANFKEYTNEKSGETTIQYSFRINEYTKYAGLNGLSEKDLGYGAVVDLIANAFVYNNKFTGGKDRVGQSASAIVVRSGATTGGDADLAELLGDLGEEPEEEVQAGSVPF